MLKLSDGAGTLAGGAAELDTCIVTLKDNMPALMDGIGKLKDGSKELNDGMVKFNKEGISKISEAVDEKLPDIADRFKALKDISQDYGTFSGKSEDMDGNVKFIYMFDGIE